ncbi:MAG: RNA polymerase factor sigma-54 [Bacteroidales bacterium]|nr:RNA polymerase factor sigma-54 [Bacteroidales bacterium]MDD3667146.1 RNA polymerase factor sigma-54 [Bacteroidales bacterium]
MISNRILQRLQQKLSPQQIQLMKLLQLPTIALEQRIKNEIEQNPTLEEDDSPVEDESIDNIEDNKEGDDEENDVFGDEDMFPNDDDIVSYKNNDGSEKTDKSQLFVSETTFHEDLISQLQLKPLSELEMIIGLEIIGNIDESGYLNRSIESIVDDFLFRHNIEVTVKEIEDVLAIIQTFDPIGVGARDLQECLLIQLNKKEKTKAISLAKKVIKKCFEYFKKKQYNFIAQRLNCSEEELQEAIDEIIKLNPKPGNSLSTDVDSSIPIIPDFIVWMQNQKVDFQVNSYGNHKLKTSNYYENLLKTVSQSNSPSDKETATFLREKLESANIFIDALNRRSDTLYLIMKAIIKYQYEYFLEGDIQKLKPMRLVDIAEMVDLDISTISRVVSNKYAQTHFGIYKLKDFFSNFMLNEQGEQISTDKIKDEIVSIIKNEDKSNPLTDDKLVEMLKDKGYSIARRTVSKYRETLNIPVARLRK